MKIDKNIRFDDSFVKNKMKIKLEKNNIIKFDQ